MKRILESIVISIVVLSFSMFTSIITNDPERAEAAFVNPHGNYIQDTPMCGYCHSGHSALSSGLLELPTQRETCYSCHNGSGSNFNVQSQFGETTIGASVYASYHPVPSGAQVCTNCHDPHLAPGATPRLLSAGAAKTASGNAFCGVCHGSGSALPGGDMLANFVYTAHDTRMDNPASGTQVKCARCHQPHGSQYDYLLRTTIVDRDGVYRPVTGNNNTFCFGCHTTGTGGYSGSLIFNAVYHGTKTSSTVALTTYKGTSYAATLCLNCHEPHNKPGITYYRRALGNTLCITCHDDSSVVRPASYSYRGIAAYNLTPHGSAEPVPGNYLYTLDMFGNAAWEAYGPIGQQPTPQSPGTQITDSRLTKAAGSNSVFWTTDGAAAQNDYNFQMYRFRVNQDLANIRQLGGRWIGYGEPTADHPTELFIWNKTGLTWESLASGLLGDPNSPGTLIWSKTTGIENYIDNNKDVYILARAKHDATAPVISGINVTGLTGTGATINFTTNETTSSYVYYGDVANVYPNRVGSSSNYATAHALSITGLTSDRTYHYQVRATDKLGNEASSGDLTFHTSIAPSVPTGLTGPVTDPAFRNVVTVNLSWTAATDPDPTDTVSYEVEVNVDGALYTTQTTGTNSASVYLGYEEGTTVSWRVRAKDNHGIYSNWSTSASFPHTGPAKDSCPILYTWDGDEFRFHSELNPGAFVGLEIAPGKYQKPIPNEQTTIAGSALREKDGQYILKIKNEQDEVDFIDNVVLEAIDHPAGTVIAQNDFLRSKGDWRIYTYGENIKPVKKATYYNNPTYSQAEVKPPADVTELVSKADKRHAAGSLFDDNQFTFDLGDLRTAENIKLVIKGWTKFANDKELAVRKEKAKKGFKMAPTKLEILQPDGTWKAEDIRYMFGSTRTAILDLTGKFPDGTKQYIVRLRGLYRPHIDFAGVDTTPRADIRVTKLQLVNAALDFRGVAEGRSNPEPFYNYSKILTGKAFGHEGRFTRFGNVLPLVKEIDDKLVVMDTGDELTLKFKALPPPAPGMVRSYLLKPWSYYKINTTVEPLPFRDMDLSGYPRFLGAYPDELKKYVEEWNTRVHRAEEKVEAGFFERIRQFFSRLIDWLAELWSSLTGKISASVRPDTRSAVKGIASGTPLDGGKENPGHYSLNTDYVTLEVRAVDPGVPPGYCGNCHTPHGKNDGAGSPIPKQLSMTKDTGCFGGGFGCHSDPNNSVRGVSINDRFNAGSNPTARHSISVAEQTALGTKVECANCHDPHLNTATAKLVDPFNRYQVYNLNNGMLDYIDGLGNIYMLVKAKHDGLPPAITTGPAVSAMTATNATISWWLSENADGRVEFGPTDSYGNAVNSSYGIYNYHSVGISGLVFGQNYHYRVRSVDQVGNYVYSADRLLDSTFPTITSGPAIANAAATSVDVRWSTDEQSTSWVDYNNTVDYAVYGYVYSAGNDTLTTTHSVTLSGLTPGLDYQYRVRTMDMRGNTTTTTGTFRASNSPPAPMLITEPDHLDGINTILVDLDWNAVTDPDGDPVQYYAEISNTSNFSSIWNNSGWIGGATWPVSISNEGDVNWYWRVKAKDNWGAESVWSSVYSFVHRGPPPPPPPPSCPIIYSWDGSKFQFVTDATDSSVGLLLGPGKYSRIRPDMQVVIPGEKLAPKDGRYIISIKNEEDEIDYHDNFVLRAVDHPVGTKIDMNHFVRDKEPYKIYTYNKDVQPVKKATYINNPTYSGGKPFSPVDITELVSKIDNRHAKGVLYEDNQFTFDLGDLKGAKDIKLVIVGWTEYANAKDKKERVEKAKKGIKVAPPRVEILQPDGTWKSEVIKHMPGHTKGNILDLSGKFPKDTKKYVVRLRGMYRPHFDFVGMDTTPQASIKVTNLKLMDAMLKFGGVSARTEVPSPYYNYYKHIEAKRHEGRFTRYGNVLPLVKEVDDKLVVMDSGDELTVSFKALPPPAPGMTRSFVLTPWNYYKEIDQVKVEPMPFKAMDLSKWPKSLGEYPEELKKYVAEWNTRVHQAGEKAKAGFMERLKGFFAGILGSLLDLWQSVIDKITGSNAYTEVEYIPKPQPESLKQTASTSGERHFSLNTNYIMLQADTLVGTAVYDINSAGSDIWHSDTEPSPSAPGISASGDKPSVAADDGMKWSTDFYPMPNQDDGRFNYQMFKFVINEPVQKLSSFRILWKGYGEPTPGHEVSISVWNFVYSRWDQVENRQIGSETGVNVEKSVDYQSFCYKCHAGTTPSGVQLGPITRNIAATYSGDIHGGGSGPQSLSANYGPGRTGGAISPSYARANQALPCADCHDLHGSQNAYHLRENPNGQTGKSVPDIANNTNVLAYCQSCHAGSLYQFHQACLDCHRTGTDHQNAPTADDFSRACTSCHYHGAVYPAHGRCHCTLGSNVRAF